MNNHVTVLEIDGNALEHNLNYFKQKIKSSTKILAVVKAFGYGSDDAQIASFLKDKVDYFAVAYTHEGINLRNAGVNNPIMVLHPQIQNFDHLVENCLEPSLYSYKTLKAFQQFADKKELNEYPVHLKFNTGLNRLGFWQNGIDLIVELISKSKGLTIKSVLSHLAASEDHDERDFTLKQLDQFEEIRSVITSKLAYTPMFHTLNTSGVVNYPEAQYDMVRIGIGLYGFGNDAFETSHLKNTHKLKSIISQIHKIEPGETVGYNRAFTAETYSKTATIPVGHADGISRQLGNKKGYVTIGDQQAPIIGNVCMDMIMVDITEIDCKEGDEVIIFGDQKDILRMAKHSNTISYEILTAISQRVKRVLRY